MNITVNKEEEGSHTTHHVIELPKSYRMNVLVLKMITLNSSYGLSKIAIKNQIYQRLY